MHNSEVRTAGDNLAQQLIKQSLHYDRRAGVAEVQSDNPVIRAIDEIVGTLPKLASVRMFTVESPPMVPEDGISHISFSCSDLKPGVVVTWHMGRQGKLYGEVIKCDDWCSVDDVTPDVVHDVIVQCFENIARTIEALEGNGAKETC